MNNKYVYCKNCGRTGHNYKKCLEPITSLGLIAFKIDFESLNKDYNCNLNEDLFIEDDKLNIIRFNTINFNNIEKSKTLFKYISFLLISRRTSLGFLEFMRGRYIIDDKLSIIKLLKQMHDDELYLLKNNNFNYLWKYVWCIDNINEIIDRDYNYSNGKFNIIKNNGLLNDCLKNIKPEYKNYEWGFPKGRRLNIEKNIDCAKREFIEETNLNESDFKILENIDCITENLIGTNNINYKHIYFIALCNNNLSVSIDKNNYQQCKEVGQIGWFNYIESIKLIREYHTEKINIINNLFIFITNKIFNEIK